MKTARSLLPLLVLALILGLVPSAAGATSEVDCGPDQGRQHLTSEGLTRTFESPAANIGTAPNETPVSRLRWGVFPYILDLAPQASAAVKVTLDWTNPSDFDFRVFNRDGEVVAESIDDNLPNGATIEQAEFVGRHCDWVSIRVLNYVGSPAETLSLKLEVTPLSELLSCTDGDRAPGCRGKAPGEPPAFVPDTRPRLYLGGDPGQVSMVHAYVNNESLPKGTLSAVAPTSGKPNQYSRPLVGFRDQYRNPFVAHWTGSLAERRVLQGMADVVLYASSASQDATGTLYIDLYADGSLIGQVKVPGDQLKPDPTPITVQIPIQEPVEATSITLQVATNPAASTSGAGNPRDAHVTLFYGSVQVPAYVTLP